MAFDDSRPFSIPLHSLFPSYFSSAVPLSLSPSLLSAVSLLNEGKIDEAFSFALERASDNGDGGSEAERERGDLAAFVAICYQGGIGVTKDEKKRNEWLLVAKEKGSLFGVAYYQYYFDNFDVAVPLFHKILSIQPLSVVQCSLGWCHDTGHGVPRDLKEGVRFYTIAAEQGYSMALSNLGIFAREKLSLALSHAQFLSPLPSKVYVIKTEQASRRVKRRRRNIMKKRQN